ncbi:Ilt1p [Ascoidea rubescens DSM 1968]|uniref:PQ-loop-domain-containing protein n=1 Tax=Ascoidea rubescens DSM 1968 TaxID=1344418 RepID=A0A1D2VPA0_9ASCO|nr:PQ-loop-domain-containing protein [Ascoidea rubescens DSM 1968]ODV63375.1 PQ-loop-domain-containing protein [Ascoidea rubescens DSM 1968]
MSHDPNDSIEVNVVATIGTVFWCIQLIPQIIRNYRVKDCTGFPPLMMILWAISGIPFSIYFFMTDASIPIKVQPQAFTACAVIAFSQALYYPPVSMKVRKLCFWTGGFIVVGVAIEAVAIVFLTPVHEDGTEWPSIIIGTLASILLASGLIPAYFELAKRQGRVVGINFVFLLIDCAGSLLSMISLLIGSMDIMGFVLYLVLLALEIGIFLSHFIWWCRFRWLKKDKVSDEESSLEIVHEITSGDSKTDFKLNSNSDSKHDSAVCEKHVEIFESEKKN